MGRYDLFIKAIIGTAFIITAICVGIYFAGGFVRMVSNGRVSQAEDTEYADKDCANIKTAKGHRVNGDECNKARARKDLTRIELFLYDGSEGIGEAATAVKTFFMRNIFIVLIACMIGSGVAFYNYRFLYMFFASLMPQKDKFN